MGLGGRAVKEWSSVVSTKASPLARSLTLSYVNIGYYVDGRP
jgi:hypothetical protein